MTTSVMFTERSLRRKKINELNLINYRFASIMEKLKDFLKQSGLGKALLMLLVGLLGPWGDSVGRVAKEVEANQGQKLIGYIPALLALALIALNYFGVLDSESTNVVKEVIDLIPADSLSVDSVAVDSLNLDSLK